MYCIPPDIVVLHDVYFVEHGVLWLAGDVVLHLHGHVAGQHAQQQSLLRARTTKSSFITVFSQV